MTGYSLLDVNNSDIDFDQHLIKYQTFYFALKTRADCHTAFCARSILHQGDENIHPWYYVAENFHPWYYIAEDIHPWLLQHMCTVNSVQCSVGLLQEPDWPEQILCQPMVN